MVFRFVFLVIALLAGGAASAAPAAFPDRPIHMIVALPAGGSVDVVARILADKLAGLLGQSIVVENRPGASGIIAAQAVSAAEPNGYTLLFTTSALAITPWISAASFDPVKTLQPVTQVAGSAYVLVVRPDLGVATLDDFIALAKARPGQLSCSTYGTGSPPHLALELLKEAAGLDIVHIPYRGFAQAMPNLMSGVLSCAMEVPANVGAPVQAGELKALAVTTDQPIAKFPGVPTIASRFPRVTVDGWQGVFVPAGTPADVVARLNQAFVAALQDADVRQRLRDIGFDPLGNDSATAEQIFRTDHERFGRVLKGLKMGQP
jgi:tripartite-type tricarboxylate transporter receptor subunit TctC